MPQIPGKSHYRPIQLKPLAAGLNDARNPTLLGDGETPDCRDIEFNHDSVDAAGGAIKFNNQVAPKSGVLTRAPVGLPPLKHASDISVPQRGYVYLPYRKEQDIGGDFVEHVAFASSQGANLHHGRRGKSFEFTVSFQLPKEEKLYGVRNGAQSGIVTQGAADTDVVELLAAGAHWDEAMEDCFIVLQKGGDRLTPMSWALGVVNVGGAATWNSITGDALGDVPSNYALVFMWLDYAKMGTQSSSTRMRYYVGTGAHTHGTTADERYATSAYRALVVKSFVEPGKNYHVAVQLTLDTGAITNGTTATPTATWNGDGVFGVTVADDFGNVSSFTDGSDMYSWKGPADNYDYLTRYGIRFSGRDAMFGGLGMRFMPWDKAGFLPFGLDAAAMESGGHRMVDCSVDGATSFGYATNPIAHTSPNTYIVGNALISPGLAAGGLDPCNPGVASVGQWWRGLSTGLGTAQSVDALRNYWFVCWDHATWSGIEALRGARLLAGTYDGGPEPTNGRLPCNLGGVTLNWTAVETYPICFRWNQRQLRLSNIRIFTTPRDYTDARVKFSLSGETLLDDQTEPGIADLVGCWPLDDAEGGRVEEKVLGADGFLSPYSLAQGRNGGVFLSGEGERIALDLSEDPIFIREIKPLMDSFQSGFAIELEVEMTEAVYAQHLSPGLGFSPAKHAPVLASWEVKSEVPGFTVAPEPILQLSHRSNPATAGAGINQFFFPQGFSLHVGAGWDSEALGLTQVVHPWNSPAGATNNWSKTADWVGKTIRLQFGVQSTGNDFEYRCYVAASPKDALFPANGDPSGAEMVYVTTQTITAKDLVRSMIVIGGAWKPFGATEGYVSSSARMLVKQVRIFGCNAPGVIPTTPLFLASTPEGQTGAINFNRDGKLIGGSALPPGALSADDILQRLGPAESAVNVTEGSTTVVPSGGSQFSSAASEDVLTGIDHTYMIVSGDGYAVREESTEPRPQSEFYSILAVNAGGTSLTLGTPFNNQTRKNAMARSFRLLGYSAFADDLYGRALTVSGGTPLNPGTSDAADNVFVEDHFANGAPLTKDFDVIFLSGSAAASEVVPTWDRGVAIPRRNKILGLRDFSDTLFATSRGCLFEVDDRWRKNGPTEDIRASLAFRHEEIDGGVFMPLEQDALVFAGALGVGTAIEALSLSGLAYSFDCWVRLDAVGAYQTAMWVGGYATDQAAPYVVNKFGVSTRFASGVPEFAIGSSATYDGTNSPDRGVFVARGAARLQPGEWTHVRWRHFGDTISTKVWISLPQCFVNGREVAVTLNATQNAAPAGFWLNASDNITSPTSTSKVFVGVARDSFTLLDKGIDVVLDKLGGYALLPDRIVGLAHSLGGRIAGVVVGRETSSVPGTSFDPTNITYAATQFDILRAPEGVGHKVLDSFSTPQYGAIRSHPFISAYHSMGRSEQLTSWTESGQRLIAANGGRPVYAQAAR